MTPLHKNLLTLGVAGVVVYFAWKKLGATAAAAQAALTQAGNDIGSAVYDSTHTDYNVNGAFLNVTFPDGQTHLVDAQTVQSHWFGDPTFVAPALAIAYRGQTLSLVQDTAGNYFALEGS